MAAEKVILGIIAALSFIGNTFTALLFISKSKWLKRAYNCLILALAVQDILLAICLVVLPGFILETDAYIVPENENAALLYCKIFWSHFIPFSLGITSVYTCLMLTFDRWLAVVKPLSYKQYEQSKSVVIFTVLFPWIAGFGLEITAPLNAVSVRVNGTSFCAWKKQEYSSTTVFLAVFTFLGMIVIPAALMVLAYADIIVNMKKSRNKFSLKTKNVEWREDMGSGRTSRSNVEVSEDCVQINEIIAHTDGVCLKTNERNTQTNKMNVKTNDVSVQTNQHSEYTSEISVTASNTRALTDRDSVQTNEVSTDTDKSNASTERISVSTNRIKVATGSLNVNTEKATARRKQINVISNRPANAALHSLKRVTLTAFFASTVVIVCWLPDQLYYGMSQVQLTKLGTTVHFIVKILAFANSFLNPVIYSFSNSAYRQGIKKMLACCKAPTTSNKQMSFHDNTFTD